jgi:hypothetical protein
MGGDRVEIDGTYGNKWKQSISPTKGTYVKSFALTAVQRKVKKKSFTQHSSLSY